MPVQPLQDPGADVRGGQEWPGCLGRVQLWERTLAGDVGPIGVVPLLYLGKAGPALGKPRSPRVLSPAAISKDLILSLLCICRVRDVF